MFNMNVSPKMHKVIDMYEIEGEYHNYIQDIVLVWDQQDAKLMGVFQDQPQIYKGVGNTGNAVNPTTTPTNITLSQVTIEHVTNDYTIWRVHL